ncbi:MAG: FISUMP domain-containing protein, partial [Bacteroidales bacterium]
LTFNTVNETGTVKDIDNNTYNTVKIGTQWWMAENLKTTTYSTSTSIPYVTDNTTWAGLSTPAYCYYNNNEATYGELYGALYNWFAVNTGNLCPTGWHVPTDADFNTLELYLGMPPAQVDVWGWRGTDQGTQMKSTSGWNSNGNGTNTSGFTALPGGYRYAADGTYNSVGDLTYWWSSTQDLATTAWYRRLDATQTGSYKATTEMTAGKSIRCVKD